MKYKVYYTLKKESTNYYEYNSAYVYISDYISLVFEIFIRR